MKDTVLVFAKKNEPSATKAVKDLMGWLKKKKIKTLDVTNSEEKIEARSLVNVRLGLVIGGDGSFLTLVRRLEEKDLFPIMGINLGTLGFITEVSPDQMFEAVEKALEGAYREERRRLIAVDLIRKDRIIQSGTVFNDAVITKEARTTMLKLEVFVDSTLLSRVRADGYIVSSPTGSTGYALSAGGSLIHPGVSAMLLIPICSHSLSARPILVPKDCRVEVVVQAFDGHAYLVFDGQINYELKARDRIQITGSRFSLRVVRLPEKSWFEVLRVKLEMR
ncbi:MAG: NAD(+)/NADH kinase [Deltaproteobacteria bacterium]|nr:NAD(+)/NADH kinase [Deltaproteobacteria bacterium]